MVAVSRGHCRRIGVPLGRDEQAQVRRRSSFESADRNSSNVADVVGYSRLTELDEEGTHARLNAFQRDLLKPKISEHRGRIIKDTGDGVLLEFASVVDAVRCAVEIQREMIDRNADFPEDRRIVFRFGINLGDVIVEPGDIHGDGVNVAARLEGLAEPGGVCISGTAHRSGS